eukprot:XP_020393569.1 uncharacterized protein LOC109939674 [Zea mays]
MPSLGGQQVRSPAFTLDLRGRDPATFVREVEDRAVRIVGRYVPRTEALRNWDIRGSNVRLNRVFELNRLPYDGYPGDDAAVAVDRRGKKPVAAAGEGSSQDAAPAMKKRKLVMERDRQDAARKSWAVTRVGDPFHEAKKARGGAKSAAPGGSKPPPATKPTAPGPNKSSAGARVAASGAGKLPSTEAVKEQRPASPALTEVAAAWSDAGQLAVIPTTVAATSPTTEGGAKGASQDPWSNFCVSGEISSAAAAKDVAGSVSQQLRLASQQLKHEAAFADHVASGAITSEFAAEVERLRA